MRCCLLLLPFLLLSCKRPTTPGTTNGAPPTTRFERLPPERTGIAFVPTLTEDYRYNFIMDPYLYNGGGVAVLDVNGDGLQDLFFTARLQGCRLYLNQGGFRFEDISEASGVSKFSGLKTGVTVADVNADGWPDLYVCRTWLQPLPERANLLLINQHDNTFQDQAADYGLADLGASNQSAFFDYDLDGDLDCYVANYPVDFKTMNILDPLRNGRTRPPLDAYESGRLYRNEGNGKFEDVTQAAGLLRRAFTLSLIAADFNDDGWPDLFCGNDFIMPDFLFINQHNGQFRDEADTCFRHTANHTMGADLADVDGDGFSDLVTLDMLAAEWPHRKQQMSTMILERDRQMVQGGYGRQVMRNTLQRMTLPPAHPPKGGAGGEVRFSEIGCLAGIYATDWSWAPLIADFDNDGRRDLFITSGLKRDLNDLDFFIYTADSINRTGGINPRRFAQFEDYVSLIPSTPAHNFAYHNTGSLPLEDVSGAWGFEQPSLSNGAAYADLDQDGDLDLITNDLGSAPGIYENKSNALNANHWLQIKCKGTALNPAGYGAKVRVYAAGLLLFSQEMTPTRGFCSSVEPIFQVGLGSLQQVDRVEVDWQEKRCQVLQNLAANQRLLLDIAQAQPGRCPRESAPATPIFAAKSAADAGLAFQHRENDFEDFDREKLLPQRYSAPGPCLAAGDLNGDGLDDLFIGGASGQAGAVFLQKMNGQFQRAAEPALEMDAGFEDTGAVLLDADRDGDLDLYVASGGNEWEEGTRYQDRLYHNDGKGQLTKDPEAIPAETSSGRAVCAFDYDGDGWQDLFVSGRVVPGRYPEAPRSFILKNEGGKFRDVTGEIAPVFQHAGMISAIQNADLDGDGKSELLLAGDWMPITVLRFDGKAWSDATQSFGLEQSAGWWNSLSISDLDGDGDPDLAAGNEGWNTRFKASGAAPLRLYASDYDHNGSIDPVLAFSEHGAFYPAAGRDQLASQMPAIKKKFIRYHAYAKVSMEEVFSKSDLAQARVLEAKMLSTSWFENQGGKFIRHDLPWEAQVAPVQRLLAGDFNGDGHADLLLAGNDYGPDVETYRMDAFNGCLLAGRQGGGFEALSPQRSGFWVPGEARDMAVLKVAKGKGLITVANNNGVLQIFEY